jgi:hypothetical protein
MPDLYGFSALQANAIGIEEWWTESWIARIAAWEGLYPAQKHAAVRRLIYDQALFVNARQHIEACVPVVFTEQASVQLVSAISADVRMTVDPGLGWLLLFDENGQITDSHLDARTNLHSLTGSKFPPLHIIVIAQAAIEQFARCTTMLRWIAGDR